MSYKSRENWRVRCCLKECENRSDKNCKECIKFSNLKLKLLKEIESNVQH